MGEKRSSEKVLEKKTSDDDFLLEDQCAILELADVGTPGKDIGKEDSEEEEVSMTEKWASFHEENPEAVEPKVAKAKMKPKASVKKKVGKEKKEKSSEVGKKSRTSEDGKVEDLNAAVSKKSEEKSKKEAKKSANEVEKSKGEEKVSKMEEKKLKEGEKKPKEDEKKSKEDERKPKEGPLTKFFTKISSSKLPSEIPKAD